MKNRFSLIIAGLIIVFGGVILVDKKSDNQAKQVAVQPSNHVLGKADSAVSFVEYGDFECPACYLYEPIVRQVREKYKDKIKFQFQHFPLVQIHQNAMAAHRAAEAAGLQGKFWEYHDLLYERAYTPGSDGQPQRGEWTSGNNPQPFLEKYAKDLGLDVQKFKQDMLSQVIRDTIEADLDVGHQLKANSTPTFVLNGKKIEDNPKDLSGFEKLIDAALAEAAKTPV